MAEGGSLENTQRAARINKACRLPRHHVPNPRHDNAARLRGSFKACALIGHDCNEDFVIVAAGERGLEQAIIKRNRRAR